MALIPLDVDSLVESKPVPIGRYNLVIDSCEEVTSKKGKPQYEISIRIDGHDDAPNVRHYQSLPAEGDKPEAAKFKGLLLKRLCHLFKTPLTGTSIDTEKVAMSLVGKSASAELSLDKETDAEGNEKVGGRTYNRLVIPYLPDEGDGSKGQVPKPPKR